MISVDTAQRQFSEIIDRIVDRGERFLVERDGEPVVMMLSVADFVETLAPAPDWLKEVAEESRRQGLDQITSAEIEAEIVATRQDRPSRQLARR